MSPATKKPVILTVDQILECDDLKETTTEVPEWGGAIRLKQVTRKAWNKCFEDALTGDEFDAELFDLYLLVESMIEPELTRDRVEQLRGKNAGVVRRLCVVAHEFNNVNEGALEAALRRFQGETD